MLVIYESRVVIWGILKSGMTRVVNCVLRGFIRWAPGLVVTGGDHAPKAVGSNPSTIY